MGDTARERVIVPRGTRRLGGLSASFSTATISPALVAAGVVGLVLGLSPFAGGFYSSSIWAPAGLALLAILTTVLIATRVRLPPPAIAVIAAIAALGLLSLASALWTDSIQQAVVEGNRLLVYATALPLLFILLRSDRAAVVAFAGFAAGGLVVATWVVTEMLSSDATLFLGGRLHDPLGYVNGQANFFLLAFWPCLALAERRGRTADAAGGAASSPLLAGPGMAAATLFAGLVVLGQSRGAVIAAALSLLVVLALLPGRLRRIVALLVSAGCLVPAMPAVLDVYRDGPTDAAAVALLLASLTAGVIWALLVALEQRGRASGLRPRRVVAIGVTALAVLTLAVAVASAGRIANFVDAQYTGFVTLGAGDDDADANADGQQTTSRLASGGGNRYDYWRIAVHAFKERPVFGIGAGGYDKPYFARRATVESIRQPHSLPLQTLVELGIAGGLLLSVALLSVAAAARQWIRRRGREPLVVASLGALVAWFAHASVDWMHLLPGLTGVALLACAVLLQGRGVGEAQAQTPAGEHPGRSAGVRFPRPRAMRSAPAIVAVAVLATAALSLSRQSLAELYADRAQAALARDPARALAEANRALRIDREALGAYYAKAAALARFGDADAARAVLHDAARREPEDFVTQVLLGDLAVRQGDLPGARRAYARALALNPREPGLARLAADPFSARNNGAG